MRARRVGSHGLRAWPARIHPLAGKRSDGNGHLWVLSSCTVAHGSNRRGELGVCTPRAIRSGLLHRLLYGQENLVFLSVLLSALWFSDAFGRVRGFRSEGTVLLRTSGQFAAQWCRFRRTGFLRAAARRGFPERASGRLSLIRRWSGNAPPAPPGSFVRQVVLSSRFRSCRGSIDGPYNIRLHLTAPRERCSHSVRGESPVIEYHPGARAHPIASVRPAVGCEPAFHRKPCDSPRPERTRDAAGEPER